MTKAQRHMQSIKELGCIVCRLEWGIHTPADAHHLLRNGRRINDFHVIPLCPQHHRGGMNNEFVVSRHPWHKEFERRYGTEMELLEHTRNLLEMAS